MNKDWFEKETEKIEVPKEDVFQAISKGIGDGRKQKKRRKAFKLSAVASSTAASLVLASGFLFAPMNEALAKVPLLGSIYENLSVGSELFASNLVTELDQKATSKGVDITITSAYYDGNVIGVTFEAEGDKLTIENMDVGNRPVSGYSFHLFDGKDQSQWASSSTELKETGDGTFVGAMEFYNAEAELPKNFTLPLTFTHMADVFGTWKFDVPVEQIPPEKIKVSGQTIHEEGSYKLEMESIIKGKATTMLEYKVTMPKEGGKDHIILNVFDDQENRLSKSHADRIDEVLENGNMNVSFRELFTSKIDENAEYLMVYPEIRKDEQDSYQSLDKSVPFTIQSERFDYQITVNDLKVNNDELIIDYQLENVEQGKYNKTSLQNFANGVRIIPTDKIKFEDNGDFKYEVLQHVSWNQKADLVNIDKLLFKSRIPIEKSNKFNVEDYSLMVPFGNLSSNDPIKMEPIKIKLK